MRSILTVDQPAESYDLTTVSTVKAELGITDSQSDQKLLNHIRQASSVIATYCNRVFGLESVTERFLSANYTGPLVLRRRPVASIVSILESGAELDPTAYYVDEEAGMLYKATTGWVPAWYGEVIVEYTAGYLLLDDLPHALERAAVLLVKQFWFAAGRDPYLRSEDIPGVASYSYGFGGFNGSARGGIELPPEVASLLGNFKEICVA